MEYIYFAKSENLPDMVKIGRTDRPVNERMDELSSDDYGPEGFDGDSTWEAVKILAVEDNTIAEAALHEHFSQLRIDDGRELFVSNDIEKMANEGIAIVDGEAVESDEAIAEFLEEFDIFGIGVGLVLACFGLF